jgi:hypothetical protein
MAQFESDGVGWSGGMAFGRAGCRAVVNEPNDRGRGWIQCDEAIAFGWINSFDYIEAALCVYIGLVDKSSAMWVVICKTWVVRSGVSEADGGEGCRVKVINKLKFQLEFPVLPRETNIFISSSTRVSIPSPHAPPQASCRPP